MTGDEGWASALPTVLHEVEQFIAGSGWDQPPQLFALVPTTALLEAQPQLATSLDALATLTPVAQEALPSEDMPGALHDICWPDAVAGCALAQEIVVLPPEAESDLDAAVAQANTGASAEHIAELTVHTAQRHPGRREARLVVAVLRDGGHRCMLRVRGTADDPDEFIERPDLAPNMVDALHRTLLG